jgi:cobalt-zinc-cadmium efflux system outer membrane protein
MSFAKPFLAVTLTAGSLSLPSVAAGAEPPATDAVLQALVDEALARNPQLAAARHLEVAAETRPLQAGSRPGPTVGVFYQNDGGGPSLGREPMTMLGVSGGQEIPYPGKLGLRRQVAQAEAAMAAFEVERARLGLIGSVKAAYHGLVLARGLASLALEQREIWQEVQETARVRYASAVGSQREMLRAQVEATRVHALHAQHHAEARARLAQLNALLGRPADAPVNTPGLLTFVPESRSAAEIVAWTEANSPELKASALAAERDERAVALARREFKPDFNLQGGVMYRGSLPPMWQLGASVMLPSRARVRGALAEAEARLAASKAFQEDVRVRLRAVVEQRLALLEAAQQIEATYRDGLLPQGDLAVQSATATYAAGQGSQIAVLEAAAALLDDRTDYQRLLAAHAVERARLEEASLDGPLGLDSLLMHGRSTTPGGGMAPSSGTGGSIMAGAAGSGARMEMR